MAAISTSTSAVNRPKSAPCRISATATARLSSASQLTSSTFSTPSSASSMRPQTARETSSGAAPG